MRTIVITGCNRGIGLELATCFHKKGDMVIGICRQSSDALEAVTSQVISDIDLTERSSYSKVTSELSGKSINVLIHNAGRLSSEGLDTLDEDAFARIEAQMQVNAYAPLRLTHCCLPFLSKGATVALITSRMGSIEDNTSGRMYGYRMSKAALNMMGKSLSFDLAPREISVAILHPGYVQTGMTNYNGNMTAEESAALLVERLDSWDLSKSGQFYHASGEKLPW